MTDRVTPRLPTRCAAAPTPTAPTRWTPRVRSIARRRANSAATALDMPVLAWPRSAPTRPSASELIERRTPCTSVQAAASASSASAVAQTAIFFSPIWDSAVRAFIVMSPCCSPSFSVTEVLLSSTDFQPAPQWPPLTCLPMAVFGCSVTDWLLGFHDRLPRDDSRRRLLRRTSVEPRPGHSDGN